MKKYIAIAFILASICACTGVEMPSSKAVRQKGEPFVLDARTNGSSAGTKTMQSNGWIFWAPEDSISIAHAAGQEAVSDGSFLFDSDNSLFYGRLGGDLLEDRSYDWYASYPYVDGMTGPSGRYVFTQDRDVAITYRSDGWELPRTMYGSTVPLFGKAVSVPSGETPEFDMYQGSHLLYLEILNHLGYNIILRTFAMKFTDPDGAEVPVMGMFDADWSDPADVTATPVDGYAYGHFLVDVQKRMDRWNENVIYIPVAPISLLPGSTVTVQALFDVDDQDYGEHHEDLTSTVSFVMDHEMEFRSGCQKTVHFRLEYGRVDNWWDEEDEDGPFMLDGETYIVDKSDNWNIVR